MFAVIRPALRRSRFASVQRVAVHQHTSPEPTDDAHIPRTFLARTALVALATLSLASGAVGQSNFPETRRQGFWFSGGLGIGSLGSTDCSDCERTNGLSGGLSLGGTITPRFLLGVGTTGWSKSENGVLVTVGTLDARARLYPSLTGGFFLTAGVGLGSISGSFDGSSESVTGTGVVLGLGVDLPVGRRTSITPYLNGVGVSANGGNVNFGQFGLAITLH